MYTDNNPLTYILSSARLDATRHRWVAELADYNFKIFYRPGRNNRDADGLSRMPMEIDRYIENCTNLVHPADIQAVVQAMKVQSEDELAWVSALSQESGESPSRSGVTGIDVFTKTSAKGCSGK